jgi:hypothetical protein
MSTKSRPSPSRPGSPLPRRPNAEFYRKQAKALLKTARAGNAEASPACVTFCPGPAEKRAPSPT